MLRIPACTDADCQVRQQQASGFSDTGIRFQPVSKSCAHPPKDNDSPSPCRPNMPTWKKKNYPLLFSSELFPAMRHPFFLGHIAHPAK
jgi:hypothetical protein